MRLIDADAMAESLEHDVELDARALDSTDLVGPEREHVQFDKDCKQNCIWYLTEQPTIPAPRWHRVEEELPDDGEWAIFTNGKVVTVERFKLDAYNHFFPASRWFDFEDAIAWMLLPEPPKEDADGK